MAVIRANSVQKDCLCGHHRRTSHSSSARQPSCTSKGRQRGPGIMLQLSVECVSVKISVCQCISPFRSMLMTACDISAITKPWPVQKRVKNPIYLSHLCICVGCIVWTSLVYISFVFPYFWFLQDIGQLVSPSSSLYSMKNNHFYPKNRSATQVSAAVQLWFSSTCVFKPSEG